VVKGRRRLREKNQSKPITETKVKQKAGNENDIA
jgi:hypothetical protein